MLGTDSVLMDTGRVVSGSPRGVEVSLGSFPGPGAGASNRAHGQDKVSPEIARNGGQVLGSGCKHPPRCLHPAPRARPSFRLHTEVWLCRTACTNTSRLSHPCPLHGLLPQPWAKYRHGLGVRFWIFAEGLGVEGIFFPGRAQSIEL